VELSGQEGRAIVVLQVEQRMPPCDRRRQASADRGVGVDFDSYAQPLGCVR
jgi:hypothetical protein